MLVLTYMRANGLEVNTIHCNVLLTSMQENSSRAADFPFFGKFQCPEGSFLPGSCAMAGLDEVSISPTRCFILQYCAEVMPTGGPMGKGTLLSSRDG